MQKILPSTTPCQMPLVGKIEALDETLLSLFYAFLVVLAFIVPSAYMLALISLRPMRQSIETIDSFINGIVHDINTPLSLIKLNAQSMSMSLEKEKHKEKNSRILQGIEDIESLEEQLLFSLKGESYQLKKTLFDIKRLLESRMSYYNDIRDAVSVHVEIENYTILADRLLIVRMIDNIVLNAIKFSPRKSKVKIYMKNEWLCIEDSGKGIKAPQEVFMKYYREDAKVKGLGLGLFIVKSVADLHGIELQIKSKVGSGTRFLLNLSAIKEK